MIASAPTRRPRRGAYLLPSLLTVGNMFLGFYAIMQAVRAWLAGPAAAAPHFDLAAKAIGWACLLDSLDGRIARLMGTTTDFGREFDSLADVTTFGVAPAFLAYTWGIAMLDPANSGMLVEHIHRAGLLFSFLFLICGAARLARFNIQTNPLPSNPGRPGRKYFVGLPIPAGAGLLAAIVHAGDGEPIQWWGWSVMWLGILLGTSLLMVSTWRYRKEIDLRRERRFVTVVSIAALVGAIWYYSEPVLLAMASAYVGSGIVLKAAHLARRRKPQAEFHPIENA